MSGPVYPIAWLPTTFRGAYPHFAKRDAPVWTRFLELYADRFDAFAYDVALGGATVTDALGDEAGRAGWQYITALKVDAVALTASYAWIFEVRPEATVSALGSVICYAMVAERDTVFSMDLVRAIVCESIQPDVDWACQQLGVQVFRV